MNDHPHCEQQGICHRLHCVLSVADSYTHHVQCHLWHLCANTGCIDIALLCLEPSVLASPIASFNVSCNEPCTGAHILCLPLMPMHPFCRPESQYVCSRLPHASQCIQHPYRYPVHLTYMLQTHQHSLPVSDTHRSFATAWLLESLVLESRTSLKLRSSQLTQDNAAETSRDAVALCPEPVLAVMAEQQLRFLRHVVK